MPSSDPVCGGDSGWICILEASGAPLENTQELLWYLLLNQNAEMSVFFLKDFLGELCVYNTAPHGSCNLMLLSAALHIFTEMDAAVGKH